MLVQAERAGISAAKDERRHIRVALVEDHTLLRASLRHLLNDGAAIKVVGDAGSAAEARAQLKNWNPDVVLMDIFLPDCFGIDLCRELHAMSPAVQFVLLSAICNQDLVQAGARVGALGYLHKTADLDQVIAAIKAVAKGHSYIDGLATSSLMELMKSSANHLKQPATHTLSAQERRVLALLVEGYTNKEIGSRLGLSDKTVKNYLANAFEKLQVTRRAAAVAAYLKSYQEKRVS